jgi:peptidoglycan/xylan/chitin deacetylase (PgdA/CDA1 family)
MDEPKIFTMSNEKVKNFLYVFNGSLLIGLPLIYYFFNRQAAATSAATAVTTVQTDSMNAWQQVQRQDSLAKVALGNVGAKEDEKTSEANSAELKDSPRQQAPSTPYNPDDGSDRTIYLSFDDGPLHGSERLNQVILDEKIKVNEFVVAQTVATNKNFKKFLEIYRQNPYVELGNHSYSHAGGHYKTFYANTAGALADMLRCQEICNLQLKIARLPGRDLWKLKNRALNIKQTGSAVALQMAQLGYRIFGWDVEWHRTRTNGPRQSVEQLMSEIDRSFRQNDVFTPNHLVILCHDEMMQNPISEGELVRFIKLLKSKKYNFEHLSKYPE